MDLSSNSGDAPQETVTESVERTLKDVVNESKQNLEGDKNPAPKKRRGRKSNAEMAAEKAALENPPFDPKPAGLAPLLKPGFEMAADLIAESQGVSDELSFPDDQSEMLATQADLVVGAFFPDVANNKWGALTVLAVTTAAMYFAHFREAKRLRSLKEAKMKLAAQNSESLAKPTIVNASSLTSAFQAANDNSGILTHL